MENKKMGKYILSLHQAATESKATLIDNKGKVVAQAAYPLKQISLKSGWKEYKPEEVLKSQFDAIKLLLKKIGPKKKQISAIGIANQPATIVMWNKTTGKPLYNAIAYHDPRGKSICNEKGGHREYVRERTGIPLSPYHSASKIRWLCDNVKSARKLAGKGQILCGTINTYLMWHLTKGAVYATDHTNAAQTLLFNIFTRSWDKELLDLFGVPSDILPAIQPASNYFGDAVLDGRPIPIHSNILEHQAYLIGNGCFQEGEANINYGKSGLILINTGKKIFILPGLLTTIAWSNSVHTAYLLEGTVNSAGSLFDWMQDNLGLLSNKDRIDDICRRSGVRLFLFPAMSPITSDAVSSNSATNISTCIFGLKAASKREDIIRSAVESIAFLIKDYFNIMDRDGRLQFKKIVASGTFSEIAHLIQFQSDILQAPLYKGKGNGDDPVSAGAAFLAGLNNKTWPTIPAIERLINSKKAATPKLSEADTKSLYDRWRLTCLTAKEWSKNFS